jgi:hypothetical protein
MTIVLALGVAGCSDTSTNSTGGTQTEWRCGSYNGHPLWTGPQGGCYYYNSNGNKSYVDRSNCNC